MTRLEELRKQKREIEAEIKKLSNQVIQVGRCKFHREHYATCRGDEWIVTYTSRTQDKRDERNKRLIANNDRDTAIAQIDDVINDLEELKMAIKESGYEG